MPYIEDAIERIKELECPTGKVENRIAGILEDYGIAYRSEVEVEKYVGSEKNGVEEFCVKIPGDRNQSIIVISNGGMDDYVTKVTDAYIK
ncbi:hypothetical protein [Clostridium sp.]|uniref:hypothetical protein n=1 Tax=Clostridium sp. TaxID=1506 RepID=UPI003D6D9956